MTFKHIALLSTLIATTVTQGFGVSRDDIWRYSEMACAGARIPLAFSDAYIEESETANDITKNSYKLAISATRLVNAALQFKNNGREQHLFTYSPWIIYDAHELVEALLGIFKGKKEQEKGQNIANLHKLNEQEDTRGSLSQVKRLAQLACNIGEGLSAAVAGINTSEENTKTIRFRMYSLCSLMRCGALLLKQKNLSRSKKLLAIATVFSAAQLVADYLLDYDSIENSWWGNFRWEEFTGSASYEYESEYGSRYDAPPPPPPTGMTRTEASSILGVGPGANRSQIRRAYYRLARQWHPDKNSDQNATERFQEIGKAYEVLQPD